MPFDISSINRLQQTLNNSIQETEKRINDLSSQSMTLEDLKAFRQELTQKVDELRRESFDIVAEANDELDKSLESLNVVPLEAQEIGEVREIFKNEELSRIFAIMRSQVSRLSSVSDQLDDQVSKLQKRFEKQPQRGASLPPRGPAFGPLRGAFLNEGSISSAQKEASLPQRRERRTIQE